MDFHYPPHCYSPMVGRHSGLLYTFKTTLYQSSAESPLSSIVNNNNNNTTSTNCPLYFKWIYEDLTPWRSTGITREMIERGKNYAHFRIVIVDGKLYVEQFKRAYQTRDVFTIWGFVQLLRFYPGKLPDVELVFGCEDRPFIHKRRYNNNNMSPPPVFIYSGHKDAYGLVFPDWSYWGWPEVNVRPWESMLARIKQGSEKIKWKDRIPYAYWKGNTAVSRGRRDLMKCNSSRRYHWNARLYQQDWVAEYREGYKNSKLEDQCTHRYKIYIEGNAWSVSEKYIMACGSTTLYVKPEFYDFFTRGLEPMKNFWPIRTTKKCRDIKFAVEWGNNHTTEAQAIGEEGARFTHEQLKMSYVYDYMLHLLEEYSKLLKFKPTIPEGAVETTAETMLSKENGLVKEYMEESMVVVKSFIWRSSSIIPCTMLPRFEPLELQHFMNEQENVRREVEGWESKYWKRISCWIIFFWRRCN
ncbi:hypothetical protein ACFE04_018781 [Oxalis oulophora]